MIKWFPLWLTSEFRSAMLFFFWFLSRFVFNFWTRLKLRLEGRKLQICKLGGITYPREQTAIYFSCPQWDRVQVLKLSTSSRNSFFLFSLLVDFQRLSPLDSPQDISPLTGGNIPFSTLEGRPSRDNFEYSPVLQDWVTATGIRIALNRYANYP